MLILNAFLAQNDPNAIFGQIKPPVGPAQLAPNNPALALGIFLARGINLFLLVAFLVAFFYGLWGAFDWITSSGQPEQIKKAQGKITQALIGLMIIFASLTIFVVLGGNVLGIIKIENGGFKFELPTFAPVNNAPPPCPHLPC